MQKQPTAPAPTFTIRAERPDQPEVRVLLAELDAYLCSLYEPEANHLLSVEELLAPEVRFVVARDAAGQAVGTGAVRLLGADAQTGQRHGEIKRMYVAPGHRGRRLGVQLIAALEAALKAEGVALAVLETGATQLEAVRLYEGQGYRRRAAFGGYPDNGLSVFMAKELV